jgi:hypothetical protein
MKATIFPSEIKQGVSVRFKPGMLNLADENQVIPSIMDGEGAAVKRRERIGYDRTGERRVLQSGWRQAAGRYEAR